MWGEINDKRLLSIKESYCLGEACLIFEYSGNAKRTVAFKTREDLKKAKDFILSKRKDFTLEIVENFVTAITDDKRVVFNIVNNDHANRLKEVLDNFKR